MPGYRFPVVRVAGLALGSGIGFIAGRWYGAIVGALLSLLVAEVLLREIDHKALRDFFRDPENAHMPSTGSRSVPGVAALIGFAMTFHPESFWGNEASVHASESVGEAARGIRPEERMIAVDAVIAAAEGLESGSRGPAARFARRAAEYALKYAAAGSAERFLRRYVAELGGLRADDSAPVVRVALALLIMSPARNGPGAVELLEATFERAGLPRDTVRGTLSGSLGGRISAWDVLGLSPGAGAEEIKKAFRAASLRSHPDALLNREIRTDAGNEEDFRLAKEACDLLLSITP